MTMIDHIITINVSMKNKLIRLQHEHSCYSNTLSCYNEMIHTITKKMVYCNDKKGFCYNVITFYDDEKYITVTTLQQ